MALMYIPVHVRGLLSLLSLAGILIGLVAMNRDTRAIALILLSGQFFGIIFTIYSVPLPGYISAVILGLFFARRYLSPFFNQSAMIWCFVFILFVFGLWYLSGPQHAYSKEKIIYIAVIGSVSLLGWYVYVKSKEIDILAMATYSLFAGIFVLSVAIDFFNFPRPSSLFDFDFFRIAFGLLKEDFIFTYHTVGIPALIAFSFLMSERKLSNVFKGESVILLVLCFWVALMSQARQAMVGIVALLFARILWDKRISVTKKVLLLIIGACACYWIITSVKTTAFETSLEAKDSTELVNRDYKSMLNENNDYLIGSGLGGYSTNGQRAYPHNLILELLFELGIIGSVLIYIPVLGPFIARKCVFVTQSNQYALMPIAAVSVRAMASGDLTGNIGLISGLVVIGYLAKNKKVYG